MKLIVTGRRVTVLDSARRQIDARLRRIERLLSGSAVSAQCVVWQERVAFVCEVTVHARGDHMLHGLGRSVRLIGAVAEAVDKVLRQAQRLKDRWKTRRRASGPARRTKREA